MNLLKAPLRRTLRLFSKRGFSRGFAVVRHLYLVMGLSMIGLAAVTVFFYVKTLRASGASVDLTFRAVPIGVALVVFLLGIAFVRSALSLFRLKGWEQALEPVSWPDSDADSEANAQTAASERVNNEKPAREAYQCTACGARIQDASEVSPRGDTRCAYCNVWFNIHRQ
jgi:DNA-directed RNA polymerase subunit RPC12/RpoP